MRDLSNITTIIWDWNGTMLNDADYCVTCMNKVLKKRQIPLIDIKEYRAHFTFPVKDYYEAIGFDFEKEDFEIPAMEFINEYYGNLANADLHKYTVSILDFFKKLGYNQLVLSAMEHENLISSLTEKGIINYFNDIKGIDNHYAHSKLEMGRNLMEQLNINPNTTLMIGDTAHDLDVANGLGIECILVSIGHQSKDRLIEVTPNVISKLSDLELLFNNK
ncbi:MAG: HAD hydrolase-like protein [Bacteroidota bacterium]